MTARRTFAQVEAAAIARDRADIAAYGRAHIAGLSRLVEAGKVPADAASLLGDRLTAFIEMIEQGLHEGAVHEGTAGNGK